MRSHVLALVVPAVAQTRVDLALVNGTVLTVDDEEHGRAGHRDRRRQGVAIGTTADIKARAARQRA